MARDHVRQWRDESDQRMDKRVTTGLASLDEILDGLRIGDNVVWAVDSEHLPSRASLAPRAPWPHWQQALGLRRLALGPPRAWAPSSGRSTARRLSSWERASDGFSRPFGLRCARIKDDKTVMRQFWAAIRLVVH